MLVIRDFEGITTRFRAAFRNGERDFEWDHRRSLPDLPGNTALTVLRNRTDGIKRRGQFKGENQVGDIEMHIRRSHGQIDRASPEHRMTEGDDFVTVAIRNRADAADVHIAANQLHADSRTGLQIQVGVFRQHLRHAAALHRLHVPGCGLLLEKCKAAGIQAGHRQRRRNRRESERLRRSKVCGCRRVKPFRVPQHLMNRRDADNRVVREDGWNKRQCADQFAVNINRAAAHARQDARFLQRQRPAGHSRHDRVAVRALIGEDAENFHIEFFDSRSGKDCFADAFHAGADVFDWHQLRRFGAACHAERHAQTKTQERQR